MTHRVHPMFAGLVRAGGAARRLVDTVERTEALVARFAAQCDAIPLNDAPDWDTLMAGDGPDDQITGLLARLAAGDADVSAAAPTVPRQWRDAPLPTRKTPSSGPQSARMPVDPFASPATRRTDTAPLGAAGGPILGQSSSSATVGKPTDMAAATENKATTIPSATGFSVDSTFKRSQSERLGLPKIKPPWLNHASSSAQVAAGRRLQTPKGAAQQAAIAQILAGQQIIPETLTSDRVDVSPVETQIAAVLTRILPQSGVGASLENIALHATHYPSTLTGQTRLTPDANPTTLQSFPRNGLERLLARAGQPRMPDPAPQQAVAPSHLRQFPDLPPSTPYPQANPPEDTPAATNSADIATALSDLIRKEARAAGIDLGGGTR